MLGRAPPWDPFLQDCVQPFGKRWGHLPHMYEPEAECLPLLRVGTSTSACWRREAWHRGFLRRSTPTAVAGLSPNTGEGTEAGHRSCDSRPRLHTTTRAWHSRQKWCDKNRRQDLSNQKVAHILVRWLSGLECHPRHQKAVGSIPGQGRYLGCGFDPW